MISRDITIVQTENHQRSEKFHANHETYDVTTVQDSETTRYCVVCQCKYTVGYRQLFSGF